MPHSSRFKDFEMFITYILQSVLTDSYYVGSCRDLDKRVDLHNRGMVKSTKYRVPWKVVYIEKFSDLKRARARELQIKSWKKRIMIENLIKHFKI